MSIEETVKDLMENYDDACGLGFIKDPVEWALKTTLDKYRTYGKLDEVVENECE